MPKTAPLITDEPVEDFVKQSAEPILVVEFDGCGATNVPIYKGETLNDAIARMREKCASTSCAPVSAHVMGFRDRRHVRRPLDLSKICPSTSAPTQEEAISP